MTHAEQLEIDDKFHTFCVSLTALAAASEEPDETNSCHTSCTICYVVWVLHANQMFIGQQYTQLAASSRPDKGHRELLHCPSQGTSVSSKRDAAVKTADPIVTKTCRLQAKEDRNPTILSLLPGNNCQAYLCCACLCCIPSADLCNWSDEVVASDILLRSTRTGTGEFCKASV